MEHVGLQTSQNIYLEQSVASIGERIVAQLVDYLVFGLYSVVVLVVVSISSAISGQGGYVLPIVLYLPVLFYDLICETLFNGQNIGKRVMKLRVVAADGSQPTFSVFFIRWLFRLVDVVMSLGTVGTITIILNGKGCRLGDLAAGTRVIRLKSISSQGIGHNVKLSPNYEPLFRESENLTDTDFALINEILDFKKQKGFSPEVFKLLENAKNKYTAKLNVATSLNSWDFLNALVKDYVFYNSRKG